MQEIGYQGQKSDLARTSYAFWKGRHGEQLDELLTVCTDCHIPANHEKGGKLWGKDREFANLASAAFMNIARWYIWKRVERILPRGVGQHMTYGAITKRTMLDFNSGLKKKEQLEKTHANDAYCMGAYRPKMRAKTEYYQKRRRNDRSLEKFYDAQYIYQKYMRTLGRFKIVPPTKKQLKKDTYKGKKKLKMFLKSGMNLGCQRTNRKESRYSDKNRRILHGIKVNKGHRSIRKRRYRIQSGSIVLFRGCKVVSKGLITEGQYITYSSKEQHEGWPKTIPVKEARLLVNLGGWTRCKK